MTHQENGFRLDAKTLSRITGGAAVLFGMSQLGGDTPHSYSPETFSNRPSLNQTVDSAPWLGRNRMQEVPAVQTVTSRPTSSEHTMAPRPVAIDWLTAGEVAGVSGFALWGAADVVRGAVSRDRKRMVGGGAKVLLATQLACGIGPEISHLATQTPQTPERPAEVQFLSVDHEQAQKALQNWLDQNAALPDGRVIQDMDGDKKIFAPIFDPPATVIAPDGSTNGSVVLAQVEAGRDGKLEYQTFLIWNDGTTVSALATGSAHASADGKSVISDLVDVNQKIRAQQETGLDLSNPSIKLVINNVTYSLQSQNLKQFNEYLTDVKFTSGTVPLNVTPTAEVATPTEVHVALNVDADVLQQLKDQNALNSDGSVNTANKYVENNADFSIAPETIKHVMTTDASFKDVIMGTDNQGHRVFWNEQKGYWTPEFTMSEDFTNPESAPYVPLEAYFDGSAHYSAAVYIVEHPGLIAADASHPYYKINGAFSSKGAIGYEISLMGMAQESMPGESSTPISYKTAKPFYYMGIQQTKDSSGAVIYVVDKDNWNPTTEKPDQTTPTFHGFDEKAYRELIQYERFKALISNKVNMPGELVPVLPVPPGRYLYSPDEFIYNTDASNPHVAALADQDFFSMLPADVQAQINNMLDKAGAPFDSVTNPRHVVLNELPPELSNLLLYTGLREWQ